MVVKSVEIEKNKITTTITSTTRTNEEPDV